uniref:Uncharacterized protein n=1 Tax=Tanacetum cinerariifolium TaxID=118510 RepID=A0A6L2MK12_TANCI|nr:hypothetical protein [Tanacetum cinerariifolium]
MDESICYRCTLHVQQMSRYAIVKISHQEFLSKTLAKNSCQKLPPKTLAKNSRQILPPITFFFTIKADQTLTITTTNRSHTLLPSKPPTDQTFIMVLMVPYEAFACPYGAEDVVLRESYKPNTRGSSSTPIYSSGSSTPPRYSPRASTAQSYSSGTSRNADCSNCKHLLGKITVLEATVEMYMHPEQHTVNSAALFHEVYNNLRKLGL